MTIPDPGRNGHLPRGRFSCTLDEFRRKFVLDSRFVASGTRADIWGDFEKALEYLNSRFSKGLVECVWVGGGYVSAKLDPSDIDVTFILNKEVFDGLSKTQQNKLKRLLRAGGFVALGMSVDGFMILRERIALPWSGGGLGNAGLDYFPIRGAWDDWWSRARNHGHPGGPPVVEDSDPMRGYLEVLV
ncbi:DUF6932 family protein [Paramicrobacterium fandaimingii]|uniref:DUF6932 family protein n=1 Tax=Paramicrobacterium fandaimingii TaxID=2708079 RepID=UPI001423B2A6|nr:hypothetical protein [Microbacterium fandaimingii]